MHVRLVPLALFLTLIVWAWWRTKTVEAGQAAVSWSRPGDEDLTFWVNPNGLEEVEIEGEVGFGDMARLLMRRRLNTESIRALRDRFTFPVRDIAAIKTTDVWRAEITPSGIEWRNRPSELVVTQGRIANLPIILLNRTEDDVTVEAMYSPSLPHRALESRFSGTRLAARSAAGYFLRVMELEPGRRSARLEMRAGRHVVSDEIRLDVRPRSTLKVHLMDEDGRPVAARVYLTGSDGLAYAPRGTTNRITAMSAEYYFHADGSFEMNLPSGRTVVESTRGIEYELAVQSVDLEPGKTSEVRLRLKRWANMAAQGWYSSDAHIHANYTRIHHQVIRPEDVRLQALAEDLNNANMMVANSSSGFLHDLQYFEGKPHSLSSSNYLIYWNEEMRNSGPYGHMCFYGLKALVHPLYTGVAGTPHWEDYPANFVQAKAARDQGGAVSYAHPIGGGGQDRPARIRLGGEELYATVPTNFETSGVKELPVDLALGEVDALDVFSNADEIGSMEIWYGLLNCGFRLGISAGSDAFTNVADHYTLGGGRVYVQSGSPFRYEDWVRAFKQGRSFASNGPVLTLAVNGKSPGEELRLAAGGPRQVRVRATVGSRLPLEKVEVVVNGQVALSRPATTGSSWSIDEEIALERSSWIALRAYGPWNRLVLNDLQALAHSSPVYVFLGDQPIGSRADLRRYREWIEQLIARVEQRGRFATVERKQEVVELFRRALDIYRQRERAATAD